ncbi:MAG: ATP-binding protein, partial [Tepidisphaeraceae bacterium]
MTLRRRLSTLSFFAVLTIGTVGAVGVAVLLALRPALVDKRVRLLGEYGVDEAIIALTGLTLLAAAVSLANALRVRRAISKRLGSFHLPLGSAATNLDDELDGIAQQFNDLTAALALLRARQRSEDEVLAAKRFTDNIIQSMFDVLIVTDPELRIVSLNKAACALLEYTELELLGKSIEEVFREERYGAGESVRDLLRSNAMRDNEMVYRTRSGRQVSALVSASTMRDDAGRPLAIITVGKDITARKQIERDLHDAMAQAEAANRAKSAFVANMSHEIRTPMTAILGYADLLTRTEVAPAEREQCVQTICRNGRHLLSIINDILDVSKIEAGKMTVERIACVPHQIVSEIAALMSVRAADRNLKFNVHFTSAIPQTIKSDPTRLRQILMNLLGNALKFTETGGVRLLVSFVEPQRKDGATTAPTLRFDIVDTGVGMNAPQIASLFRPFMQADSSTTRKFGGTGLGLTISKRLAAMLGGDLTVHSIPGEGSTFSLTVATGDLAGVEMAKYPSLGVAPRLAEEAMREPASTHKLVGRVLLAEDGADNRALISHYLREVGLDVSVVENGLAARDLALRANQEGQPFDVILMDMQMPELDGYEAARQLRAAGYRKPIVALTAHAMGGDREKCIAAGCDDFGVKPIEWEKLLAVLRKYTREADSSPSPRTRGEGWG